MPAGPSQAAVLPRQARPARAEPLSCPGGARSREQSWRVVRAGGPGKRMRRGAGGSGCGKMMTVTGNAAEHHLYADLASWWPLISGPEEYTEEAATAATILNSAAIDVHE